MKSRRPVSSNPCRLACSNEVSIRPCHDLCSIPGLSPFGMNRHEGALLPRFIRFGAWGIGCRRRPKFPAKDKSPTSSSTRKQPTPISFGPTMNPQTVILTSNANDLNWFIHTSKPVGLRHAEFQTSCLVLARLVEVLAGLSTERQ